MSDPSKLRAKALEAARQRPVALRHNSWAEPTQEDVVAKIRQDGEKIPLPTNRMKYENKPSPAIPTASPDDQLLNSTRNVQQDDQGTSSKATNRMKYENEPMLASAKVSPIEKADGNTGDLEQDGRCKPSKATDGSEDEGKPLPATPKASLFKKLRSLTDRRPDTPEALSGLNKSKGRAVTDPVTDPVTSKRLFPDNKRSGSQDHIQSEELGSSGRFPSLQEHEKLYEVLRDHPVPHNTPVRDGNTRQSELDHPIISNPSTQHCSRRSMDPNHQVRSNPIPTRRYFEENKMPKPLPSRVPRTQTSPGSRDGAPGSHKADGVIVGYGNLNPTREGTYARVGEVGFVEMNETQRVVSQAGLIETAESPSPSDGQRYSGMQSQGSRDRSLPSPHSSSVYGNVWENNPRVGYTLPAFSPAPPHHPYDSEALSREPSSGSAVTIPLMFQDFYNDPNRVPSNPPPTNSWAPNSQGNSFGASAPPAGNNGVPPPPAYLYPDYQQSGSLQSILSHLEFKLHHHIDTCFGSLSRSLTENKDNVIDRLITRIDGFERMLPNNLKELGGKVKEIEKDVKTIVRDNESLKEVKDLLDELCVKFGQLKKAIDEQNHVRTAVPSAGEHQPVSYQQAQQMHRRTENANTSAERSERYRQYPTSPNQSSNVSSGSGYRGGHRRSNTVGGTGAEDEARKDFFAHLGAAIGSPPNLKDHPAFRATQRERPATSDATRVVASGQDDSDYTLYHVPSFSDGGWYRQAYGS